MTARSFKARLIDILDPYSEARHCVFDIPESETFEFLPGQSVRVTLASGGQFEERDYSIASAPYENRFELCMMKTEDKIGGFIGGLKPGQWLDCRGPQGDFALREPDRPMLFVGTGLGVAPLRSMIEALIGDDEEDLSGGQRIVLLHGARSPDRLLFLERLQYLAETRPNFLYVPTISRGSRDWEGKKGRVLAHLPLALNGDAGSWRVYLCGRPEVAASVKQGLIEAGLDAASIYSEQ